MDLFLVSEESFVSNGALTSMQELQSKMVEILGKDVPACQAMVTEYANFGKNKWYKGFCDKVPLKFKPECEEREQGTLAWAGASSMATRLLVFVSAVGLF